MKPMKTIASLILVLALAVSVASAADFSMRVSVTSNDGEDRFITEGKTLSIIAEPGEDNIGVIAELDNDLDEDTDMDNITVTATLFNITEGQDIQEISDPFSVTNSKSKEKKLQLDIPSDAEELKKRIEVKATGTDENGTVYTLSWHGFIIINDPDHEIEITNVYANQTEVPCGSSVAVLSWVENRGTFDESSVVVSISQEELGIAQSSTRSIDEDEKESVQNIITIPEDTAPGTYQFSLKSYYKTNRLDDAESIALNVAGCGIEEADTQEDSADSDAPVPIGGEDETNQPPVGVAPSTPPSETSAPPTSLWIGIGIAVVALIAILLASALVAKKR